MNRIDRIILKKGEKALLPFRSTEAILRSPEFADYSNYFPVIKTLYEQAGYWHGTGRYQYAHTNGSRYGKTDFKNLTDVLASIVNEGGLKPHDEPWLKKIQKISSPTISLSPYRVYSRLYAGLFLYENDELLYAFGTAKIWFRILIAVQVLNEKFLRFFATDGFRLAKISSYRNAQIYLRSIRSKPTSPFKGHLIRTDIASNYPILIGIKKSIETIPLNPLIERLESRTSDPIFLKDMTHIEVPLSKVLETEKFLKEKNISLKVIPLEFGEMYCSILTLQRLIGI